MKICPQCQAQLQDDIVFCPRCGASCATPPPQETVPPQGTYTPPYPRPTVVYVDPSDHTAEFDSEDIHDNKLFALLGYILGTMGILIALLAAKDSPFVRFHMKQMLKILICTWIVAIISAVFFWTVVIPIAGGVCTIILLIVRVICFCQAAGNKAKDAAIVKGFGFLK